jgi:hypothetical protein
MCLKSKNLVMSHLIPSALYDYLRQPDFKPVRVGDGVVMTSDRQDQVYLLCLDCEDILNKGGESWLNSKLCTMERTFPLFDLLIQLPVVLTENDDALYYSPDNSVIDFEKVTHFGMGIFWKAAVHPWRGNKTDPLINLGPYTDPIRRWLLREVDFPQDVQLWVSISKPEHAQIVLNPPTRTSRDRWTTYLCHVLGLMYQLNIGAGMDQATRETCFYRNSNHPIMVSTTLTKDWERRLARNYNESRKTKAFLNAREKRLAKQSMIKS